MRIFVGTLKTIENEFKECCAAIARQSHQDFEHVVFEDLPNKAAHDALYRGFMARSDEFDLMIKVDADMVIEDEDLFAKITDRFEAHPNLKDLEIAVHDFFSDQLIWGMHAYRNTMRWESTDEDLFVDRCPVAPEEHMYDDSDLAPAAIHCKNPSPFQAFHYGVHKALKMLQPGRREKNESYTRFHWRNINRTREHFERTGDRRLAFALLGAEMGFRGGVEPAHIDYSNPFLHRRFKPYADLSVPELREKIQDVASWTFLPSRIRRHVLVEIDRLQTYIPW
jgi:hypothetical protein